MVMTTSAPSATSAAEPPALAPASTRARTGSGERLWTVTSWPARTRCSAMGWPITPRPMNPIAAIDDLLVRRQVGFRDAGRIVR